MKKKEKNKFQKKVDRTNRLARYIITLGGYGIIISIVGILFFLVYQSLPLSFKASLKKMISFDIDYYSQNILRTGIDEYQELTYTLNNYGVVNFYSLKNQVVIGRDTIPLDKDEKLIAVDKGSLKKELFAVGTNRGKIFTIEIRMIPKYEEASRTIEPFFRIQDVFKISISNEDSINHVEKLGFCENEDGYRYWSWLNHYGEFFLKIFDADEYETYLYNLTKSFGEEKISTFTFSHNGEYLIVGSQSGELFWFDLVESDNVYLKDNWKVSQTTISALSFLLGDNSLIIADEAGSVETWFPVRDKNNQIKFKPVHKFKSHASSVKKVYCSPRNRTFLTIDETGIVHLNYSTSSKTQLEFKQSEHGVQTGAFTPKSNGIVLVDNKNRYGLFKLSDEHPEATLTTLFGKVWYEGYNRPEFVWQSTGGSDEFEPKLSIIPLIFGTLKGTIYAMIFSIPLAILAAIYVSQFSPKWLSRTIKPTVEIMAALPSVVIGFLAGLYFSPLFEEHLMTLFLFVLFLPILFGIGIIIYRLIPEQKRIMMPVGWELLFVIPLILINYIWASAISSNVELLLFSGNIKQWLFDVLGQTYDQRNSIVVGFALGFAVIPIIFTISEDALSNIPESLTSASLALGASRWQTVRRVVLPAAAGGIFAAVMLGFGRAIGETMIVLMATGNTPILDISPFNGFRAMSACIAVEIPEAPVGGTLYRILFLIALLLFIFTFIINSISALIGDRLRKKYARF
jgi:phosphate transport system permease protein